MADKSFQPFKDVISELYGRAVRDAASWIWRGFAVTLAALNGAIVNIWIPQRLLKDTETEFVIQRASMIAWGWGVPAFIVVALVCSAILWWSARSTLGIPHAEIGGLRSLYRLLHLASTAAVTLIIAFFLARILKDPSGGLTVGFWITLAAVATSYSIVYVFVAAYLLPSPLRVAAAYSILRRPLVALGF